jgi:hypothetical protein
MLNLYLYIRPPERRGKKNSEDANAVMLLVGHLWQAFLDTCAPEDLQRLSGERERKKVRKFVSALREVRWTVMPHLEFIPTACKGDGRDEK